MERTCGPDYNCAFRKIEAATAVSLIPESEEIWTHSIFNHSRRFGPQIAVHYVVS
jgi:hypothetical protein